MAVATTTALAIGGMAVQAATAGASFVNAAKQKKLQKEAMEDAAKALQEAKDRLNVNYFDALSIQKEPYELQREAALAQGAQAIEAANESDRGAAAAAGRVQMAQNEMQAGIRSQMSAEMQALDKLKASEDAKLAQEQASINLQEVQGAQQAAADAQKAAAQSTTQGLQSLSQMGQSLLSNAPLYGKSSTPKGPIDLRPQPEQKAAWESSPYNPFRIGLFQNQSGGSQAPQLFNSQGFPTQEGLNYLKSQNPFDLNNMSISPNTFEG
jgi:hypothetical protein